MTHDEERENTTAKEAQSIEADREAKTPSDECNRLGEMFSHANMMTQDEALAYIADEMQTVLDDDYPDKQEALVDDLMTEGFTEDEAEELVYG